MGKTSYQRRKRVATTVYLDPEQVERLRRLHERTKVLTAVRIREAVNILLDKYKKKSSERR